MDKRFSQRKTGKFLAAAAVAGLGLAGAGASQADAALVIDVRAIVATGGTISQGGKLVEGTPSLVTMGVYAQVSGANSVQEVGEFGGDSIFNPAQDTRNDDSVQIVTGNFTSGVGGLLGNFTADPQRVNPFTGSGSSDGQRVDLDADGDLDIGINSSLPDGMFSGRSGNPTYATMFDGTVATPAQSRIINATTSELLIGLIRWQPTGGSGTASVNFIPRPGTEQGAATWFEDGVAKDPGKSSFSAGTPVAIGGVIPEPASLGLLGMAGLGLLARRRTNA